MNKEELINTCICNVPFDLHGTCCGWENAKVSVDDNFIITDKRHPGFGSNLNRWKGSFYENPDGYDISTSIGFKSGWDKAAKELNDEISKLQEENERLKQNKEDLTTLVRQWTEAHNKVSLSGNEERNSLQSEIDRLKELNNDLKRYHEAYQELKKDLKDQEQAFCAMTSNRTAFKFWKEKQSEIDKANAEIESLKGKLNKINDEIGKASIPEYGDCKITAKSIGVIIGLTL